jgi:DnaJ homolog subfamily C member 28
VGTPFQREKQYQQRRAQTAAERVMEHRVHKAQATEKSVMKKGEFFKKHAIKTKYGFDRVVEDLIQESMSKGDFNNLTGSGKPLSGTQQQNPYVDFTTAKLNKILLDNGFTPEWIMLQKEIREEIADLKSRLGNEWQQTCGDSPSDKRRWQMAVMSCQTLCEEINKKIDKFNLIVPILHKQMVQIRLETIAAQIEAEPVAMMRQNEAPHKIPEKPNDKSNLLSYLGQFFS